ncbi:MAG: Crp/Fnr family transcriptional regulator [Pyrinomonadaceae bacterium]
MPYRYKPKSNCLLSSLPAKELARIEPYIGPADLPFGTILYETGEKMSHVYFPTTAIISLMYETQSGETAEIGIAGNQGMIGVATFLGGDTTVGRAMVQTAGHGVRIPVDKARKEFQACGEFQEMMLRYSQAFMTQISQSAVCNRLHSVLQRLCRWLLMTHDQLPGDRLMMTHDVMAHMLGVRREGVTIAAGQLQDLGIISYTRGSVVIRDRAALEKAACECYEVVADEYERLIGPLPKSKSSRNGSSR